jgi:hypothetical protein
VHHHSLRNLNLSILTEGVRARRLEEEEGLLGSRVVELFDVSSVVAADGDTLKREKRLMSREGGREREKDRRTFFPRVAN